MVKESLVEYEIKIKKKNKNFIQSKITSSIESNKYAKLFFKDDIDIYESFFVIFLNRNNTTIGYLKISQGGVYSTITDVKLIILSAINNLASGIILVHNHPSGQLKPSNCDITITDKIKKLCLLADINLIDHLIITSNGYLSMADEGLLNQ